MSQLPTCCEYHKKTECGQGDNCPARNRTCPIATTYAETEGVMTMPTGCSTKALPDPKRQPLPALDDPTPGALLLAAFTVGAAFGGAVVQLWGLA